MMQESELCAATARPVPGYWLAPLGLSENDCLGITDFIRSAAPGWETDLQEDAFGQLGLVMAPSSTNRLELALMAYRIGAAWYLEEVRAGAIREVGEFQTIDEFLRALASRLEDCFVIQACDPCGRPDQGIETTTAVAAYATTPGDAEGLPPSQDVPIPLKGT